MGEECPDRPKQAHRAAHHVARLAFCDHLFVPTSDAVPAAYILPHCTMLSPGQTSIICGKAVAALVKSAFCLLIRIQPPER